MRAGRCGPLRPGNAMTAARFFDGMYQPWSSSPSLVVNDTSSYGAPSSGVGTNPRATCVKTYDRETGPTTNSTAAIAHTATSVLRR